MLREGVRLLAQGIMEAEVSELTGVAKGERNPELRLTHRNGYRDRRWDTRVGTIDLAVPRVRDGSYFPSLLEPRRRAERAMLAVVQEADVSGVSTSRVDDLVRALGIEGIGRTTPSMTRSTTPCILRRSEGWQRTARSNQCGVQLGRHPLHWASGETDPSGWGAWRAQKGHGGL